MVTKMRDRKNEEIGERIHNIRRENRMTQKEFGSELGVSTTTINQLEKGNNAISRMLKQALCRRFNINQEWLEEGTGEMHTASDAVVNVSLELTSILNDNPEMLGLVKRAIRKFSPEDWSKVNDLLKILQD